MNGHAKGCLCQSCTIGREIGMDEALELILEMREALDAAVITGEIASSEYDGKVYEYCTSCGDNDIAGTIEHEDHCDWISAKALISKASALLAQHNGEDA